MVRRQLARVDGAASLGWLRACSLLAVASTLLLGCGGAVPRDAGAAGEGWDGRDMASAGESFDETAPRSGPITELDALELDLAVSERRLDEQLVKVAAAGAEPLGPVPAPTTEPALSPPPRYAAPPPGVGTDAPAGERAPAVRREETLLASSSCDIACRSLASMRQAAEGICRLTSEDHARCQRARGRVGGAEQRIRGAGCGCVV